MKPADHEYKVMGLAAYNNEKYGESAYEKFRETLTVDGLAFKYKKQIKMVVEKLKEIKKNFPQVNN